MSPSIYNTTDGPLAIDRAGRMLAAGERRDVEDVDGSPLAGHIEAARIVIVDSSPADDVDTEDADQQTSTRTRKGRASTTTQEA